MVECALDGGIIKHKICVATHIEAAKNTSVGISKLMTFEKNSPGLFFNDIGASAFKEFLDP